LVEYSRNNLELIDIIYSEYLGHKILEFIQKYEINDIDFISSHGHTALHQPISDFTYQIGNKQTLADILGLKVICDFRVQDVKLGGQGAPLVPIGDRLLFSEYDYCLNLGGFANISFEEANNRIAFDICPFNIVLNHYVSDIGLEYDEDGALASKGMINQELFKALNNLSFYNLSHPKSLGLEWVKEHIFPLINSFSLNLEDQLCTIIEHCAFQISKVLKTKRANVLITGGGAYNKYLISRIRSNTQLDIVIPSTKIIEFKEALIFAFLGVLRDRNEVNCLASVTGARKNHSSGKILLP